MKKYILLVLIASLSCGIAFAQGLGVGKVTGSVSDPAGNPIAGATVKVKDTNLLTMSDGEGAFSLTTVGETPVLVVSFLGYTTREIPVKAGQESLKVVLEEDARQLDEVIVVGYGTQKKAALTSSVEVVQGEDLKRMPVMNVNEALVGLVAGVTVQNSTGDPSSGKESDIRIRGINGTPLLVIDGVPRFGENTSDGELRMSDLNPDDIESISLLKDGAAAAVYGARAANGVILVKTKRGTDNQKVRVNYRGQFNMQQATCLPDFLDAREYAELFNRAVDARGDDVYEKYDLDALGSDPNLYGNENLLDYLDKFGFTTLHSVSVAGGNRFVKYYISGGYTYMKGLYSGVGRNRFNYAAKLDAYITKGLTLSFDITGNRSNNKNTSYTTIDAAYSYSPLQVLRFTSGELASISGSNPLLAVDGLGGYIRNKTNFNTFSATLTYDFPFLKGMSVYLKATIDNNNSVNSTFNSPETLYLYDAETGAITEDPLTTYPTAKISLSQRDQSVDNKLFEGGINYNRTFREKHDFGAMAVVNYQDYRNRYMTGTNNNMAGKYPEVLGTATDSRLVGDEYFNQRASLIGRFTYGYDKRYFVETSFRLDGSTKLPPEHRWGFFPTVSAAWVLSNETFFKEWSQPVVSNFKLRASTGVLGRDAVLSDYGYLMNYIYTVNSGYQIDGNFKPGVILDPNSFPNPDLKWEKSHDYNVAVDAGLWKNRIAVTYEYYWRFKTDMLTYAPTYLYPPTAGTGGNVPYVNFGKIKAWGWDLTISHKNSVGQFKYDVAFTLSKTFDKVLDYGDESSVEPHQRRKGRSSQLWLLYQSDGLFQSWEEIAAYPIDQDGMGNSTLAPGDIKYKDVNGDNVISTADRVYMKSSSYPDFSASFSFGLSYKGFYMNAMLQGVTGYSQQINELYTLESSSLQRFQRYHLTDTWSEQNPNAAYPRIKFASRNDNNRKESDFWVRNCNYLRLRSLTVGYAFPARLLKKMKVNTFSIALQGSNLFTVSSLENGIDPESLRGYPIQRSYGVTLNFGF